MMESADLGQRNDAAILRWLNGARLGRILVDCEMGARAVIVAEVVAKTTTDVLLVEDNHMVEQFASDGRGLGRIRARTSNPKVGVQVAISLSKRRRDRPQRIFLVRCETPTVGRPAVPSRSTRLGRRIYELRRASEYSQEELAERAGISVSYLSMIERAERTPHVKTLEKLVSALDVSIAEIFRGVG